MAMNTRVPISSVRKPVSGRIAAFIQGIKNVPTHLHIGLLGQKTGTNSRKVEIGSLRK